MKRWNALRYPNHKIKSYKKIKVRTNSLIHPMNDILFTLLILSIVLCITGCELKLLQTNHFIKEMLSAGINYDAFREMKMDESDLTKSEDRIIHLLKKSPELKDLEYANKVGYLTFSMMAKDYNLIDNSLIDERTFKWGIEEVATTKSFQELYNYYNSVLSNLEYFPVPDVDNADVYYEDGWNNLRTYGGNRRHEGTDLMASNNLRGFFPVITMTDGLIEKMGWLEQGGYRIGVRSETGGYFYYAHLYSYAPELKEGAMVIAGQLLGFMGDSGYGKEGTIGEFDVHLHLGIYVDSSIGEMSVNPYWILKSLEKYRTYYAVQ